MKIHHEELSDVVRYLEIHKDVSLEEQTPHFEGIMRAVQRYHPIDAGTQIIEIGTGTGWLPILCKMRGWNCKGLEISPQLIEFAKQWGAKYGIDPAIELGNLEDNDIGRDQYDIVICSNVFEHVEHWREGVRKVYDALKPGGVMFFESTNKFSFTSGEYNFPLYGWLPNWARYKLRIARQGPDIMKLGIDFHQFTHSGLRREFKRAGFSRILDRVQLTDEAWVSAEWKKTVVRVSKRVPPAKAVALMFSDATRFICVK
ncbi:MAG TPA: class I SAM-dependent methyltransferase [Bryobacteraceae bacterium]|nr:class I SAM-dependent methyltransferase [Bryobacteraceae bacterium]